MNARERFLATMRYGPRDRPPRCELSFWPETLERWRGEGMPDDIYWNGYDDNATDRYFGLDRYREYTGVNSDLCPQFPERLLEDRGEIELRQQADGVRVLRSRRLGSIPQPQHHLLVDRDSWRTHYAPRLVPDDPRRLPPDWSERLARWRERPPEVPLVASIGSLWGKLRNWMGVEQVSLLLYDDPPLFEEMVEAMTELSLGVVRLHRDAGVRLDAVYLWEDLCYNHGPLVGPGHLRDLLLLRYRRITDACRAAGVEVICVDTDGAIDEVVPVFLDAGINVLYPVEIGTTANDPVAFRRRYGRDLRMMGGFDKRLLAGPPSAIDAQIERLAPLVADGGYIPTCDHYVPPDVPLAAYRYFRERASLRWG